VIAEATAPSAGSRVRDLFALGKPRLSLLVLFTTGGGIVLAPVTPPAWRTLATLATTALVVAAANALNSYIERYSDGLMHRTQNRPLPAGRLEPRLALVLGTVTAALALPALAWVANPLTACLGGLAFALYVFVYTPMKKKSPMALIVGAVPGAMPALMGWTAATGSIDAGGLAFFAILFFWQLPHFLAVASYLQADYARAGLKVFPLVYGERATRIAASITTVMLIPVTYLPVALGIAGAPYMVAVGLLGVVFLGWALSGHAKGAGARWARGFFLASLGYLTLLYAVLIVGAQTA
jgi:protoheme IX farnesyltransferase